MLTLLTKIFGTANDRIVKKLYKEIDKINAFEPLIKTLTDQELAKKTPEFKERLKNSTSLDGVLYEAFAVVREASKRVIGQRHYDVQLIGGLILHRGMITEMRTGEGKTLVSTLPAYLNALTGNGVHVVTVNDYLAKRDSEWMGEIFKFLGLTVSCVVNQMDDKQRKSAYDCDITYATNNELGFDYLRDNMKFTEQSKVQRVFNYAIIDEVDSILIDEARTPLVISGPVDVSTDLHSKIKNVVHNLTSEYYEIDEKTKSVTLTDEGINHMELILFKANLIKKNSSLYDFDNLTLVHYVNQALRAHFIFARDVDYLVKDKKVMIIDEFTGRIMDGRRYSDGLHQALEAKENVPINNENQTLASVTFQNYFRMYPKLSGMTGTAMTESDEFKDIYNLDVVSVPTHKKVTRIDHNDVIYGTIKEKFQAIIDLIKDCSKRGQPVLVGTVSIEKSEEISKALKKYKIKHNVLNAKMHEHEANVIAQAGRYGAVTIATNMAGRGTDIRLGGNPEMLIQKTDLSLDDKLHKEQIKQIELQVEEEKKKVIKSGGLYVIGTERHESRRIDNQLRGRSGRQGDPGDTQFFLSLEDDLMRIFASDKVSYVLRSLGLKDGEAIYHPMINRSLEKAQQKVEQRNYEIRKNLLKFDDIMNDQRNIIYDQRNEIIASKEFNSFVETMGHQVCTSLVQKFITPNDLREDWKLDELSREIYQKLFITWPPEEIENIDGNEKEIINQLYQKILNVYQEKLSKYGKEIMKSSSQYLLLATLDQSWKEHLHNLDYLRQGISLRAYGQKDPFNEYNRESFGLFQTMLDQLRELFIQRICLLNINPDHLNKEPITLQNKELQEMSNHKSAVLSDHIAQETLFVKAKPFKAFVAPKNRDPSNPDSWGKLSRNEHCPCNSGKKYKHCHGAAN